ncbi:MAG TPA: pilin [Candidatus Saccharimonadales bacterium]|nr:pilin [Candidatus Saccharimonadales bacterium]
MIKRIKVLLTTVGMISLMLSPMAIPVAVHADTITPGNIACGADGNFTPGADCSNGNTATSSIDGIIQFTLNIFSLIVGIVAVIMIIVGGLKYILSGGESSKTAGAKDTILFAIIGLVVVALAQIIVHFVLSNVANGTNGTGGS